MCVLHDVCRDVCVGLYWLVVCGVGVVSCCCGLCFCVGMGYIDDVGYCVYIVTWVGCIIVVFSLTCVGIEWCECGVLCVVCCCVGPALFVAVSRLGSVCGGSLGCVCVWGFVGVCLCAEMYLYVHVSV